MQVIKYPDKKIWEQLLSRPALDNTALFETVRDILRDVETNGDEAVLKYEARFDNVDLKRLTVTEDEIKEAEKLVPEALKKAIRTAMKNIETFHASQQHVTKKVETTPGVVCWQQSVAIEKVLMSSTTKGLWEWNG